MPSFLSSSLVLVVYCLVLHLCDGSRVTMKLTTPSFTVKAVNLGGWLVTEGWIKPELFDGIVNKDLLDGYQVQFKSNKFNKFMCAENGGGDTVVVNRQSASSWETFRLWRINEKFFNLRVNNDKFVGLNNDGNAVAVADTAREWEVFEIIRNPDNLNQVRLKAYNGKFFQAKEDGLVGVEQLGQGNGWDASDPSIFEMTVLEANRLQGEFQVTNGYGPKSAPQVMKDHWNTFVVESDFKFMSENGINTVRIPVGWWIAYGSNPPAPYVAGSLQALDNAFSWAEKYNIKVIVDLHAAPGSQNGWEHSASRDGSIQWGQSDASISDTVAIIDFLANRYSKRPSLYAIELLNEPRAPTVSVERLVQYYKAGYNAVRKYSSTAYVVMSNRISGDSKEFLQVASGLSRTVIDVHYYNLFDDRFNGMTAQQNIDFVRYDRAAQLKEITTADGPLIFVGEWVAQWGVNGASKEDYQKFAAIQLEVYGQGASFGWAYWTLKNKDDKWSLESMIKNGYIKL